MEHRNETSEILRNGFLCPSFHRKTNTSSLSLSLSFSTLSLIPEKIMCFISYEIFKVGFNFLTECWISTSNNMIFFFAKFNQILIKFIVWIWIPKYHSKFHSGFCCSSKPQNFMVFHWKKTLIKDTTSNISLFSNPIGFYWIWHHIPTYLSLYFSKSYITKKP